MVACAFRARRPGGFCRPVIAAAGRWGPTGTRPGRAVAGPSATRGISYTSDTVNPLSLAHYPYPIYVAYRVTPSRVALSFVPPDAKDAAAKTDTRAVASDAQVAADTTSLGWANVAVDGSRPAAAKGDNAALTIAHADSVVLNPAFRKTLYAVLAEHVSRDEGWQSQAAVQVEGSLNLNDQRVYVPFGRVGDPEDILGCVEVSEGQIVPATFEPMPTWRPMTPSGGLFQLSAYLHQQLVNALSAAKTSS